MVSLVQLLVLNVQLKNKHHCGNWNPMLLKSNLYTVRYKMYTSTYVNGNFLCCKFNLCSLPSFELYFLCVIILFPLLYVNVGFGLKKGRWKWNKWFNLKLFVFIYKDRRTKVAFTHQAALLIWYIRVYGDMSLKFRFRRTRIWSVSNYP